MCAEVGPVFLNSSSSNSTIFLECIKRPTGPWFWSVFSMISFVLGISASLIVLWELLHRRGCGVINDIFMLNLSIIDLTFMVTLVPTVCNFMVLHRLHAYLFSTFMHSLPLCGRPLFMTCICGDCYFAVVHPIVYKTSKNGAMIRKLASATVWIITVCYGSLLTIQEDVFSSPLIAAPLTVVLPAIMFCDISVLRALRRPDPSGNSNIHPQKKRALHIIINSFIMTFTVYLPPAIIFSFADILPITKVQYFCTLTFYGICFCIAGCVIMPVLYLHTVGKMDHFKAWLRRHLGLKCCCRM